MLSRCGHAQAADVDDRLAVAHDVDQIGGTRRQHQVGLVALAQDKIRKGVESGGSGNRRGGDAGGYCR